MLGSTGVPETHTRIAASEADDPEDAIDEEAGLEGPTPFRRYCQPAQDYRSVYAAGPTKQARTQHVDNLMAVLKEGLLQHQYGRVAEAASILVPLLEEGERSKSGTMHIEQQLARHMKAVQGALECVLQGGRRQGTQYVRLLGKLQAKSSLPGSKGPISLEQARNILSSGDLQYAYDTAAQALNAKAPKEVQYAAHTLCGLLCHSLWAAQLQCGTAGVAEGKKRKAVDWFAPEPSLQAAAGRAAAEYRRDAERHLQEALNLQPGAVDAAFALIQLQFAVGKHEAAMLIAATVAKHSPEDANSHALHLLCMEALGKVQESPQEALEACLSMLQCDGLSHSAAAMVRRLSAEDSLPAADMAEAFMLHIEACTPLVREQLTHWQPRHRTAATEQASEHSEQSSSSREGLSERAKSEGVPDLLLSCALGDSWQGLADVICQAGRRALDSLPGEASKAIQVADPHEGGNTLDTRGVMHEWNSVKQVLDSRAWWWSKAPLDAKVQAWYLSAVKRIGAAGAMTITSDIMMRRQGDLEESASIMNKLKRNQAALGRWYRKRLTIADEILQKL